jgi:TrmH family RNA methyltransferase
MPHMSDELVVLEGFHAVKHALRFGADVVEIEAADPDEVLEMAGVLAPDLAGALSERLRAAPDRDFEGITGRVIARARRPDVDLAGILRTAGERPVVLLDRPRHLGNVGASIRVAAAAGARAVATTGTADPWHPVAVRGAAGLQFALPVGRVEGVAESARPVVALDPEGEALRPGRVPPGAILAFGSERHGLSDEVRAAATVTASLPMTPGVSSINLAAAVAATLYALRLAAR